MLSILQISLIKGINIGNLRLRCMIITEGFPSTDFGSREIEIFCHRAFLIPSN